jgi:hypothetical protein
MSERARALACACKYLAYPACNSYAHIMKSFVTPLAPPYFSTLSHIRRIFESGLLNMKLLRFFLQLFLKHFLFYEEFSEILS